MKRKRLTIAGVGLRGDGYPNAANTARLLEASDKWEVRDRARWLPPSVRLWHLVSGSLLRRLYLLLSLLLGGAVQAVTVLFFSGNAGFAYLPYPAPFTLWWLSFVPARWRPSCIADAYISIWDSMFRDRRAGNPVGVLSRMVLGFERRSLRAATLVLVDTEANKAQMVTDLGLNGRTVRSMPLAIRQELFRPEHVYTPSISAGPLRVLFVGTLVPLHGIEVVLSAIEQLGNSADIEFRLIGNGQQGTVVETFIREQSPSNLTWIRDWQSLEDIAHEISQTDVCLGVFGGLGKAARVLPFKLYYALAAGKAVVTQAPYSLPKGLPSLPAVTVRGSCQKSRAKHLAESLRELSADSSLVSSLGLMAADYFHCHLSSDAVVRAWERQVMSFFSSSPEQRY